MRPTGSLAKLFLSRNCEKARRGGGREGGTRTQRRGTATAAAALGGTSRGRSNTNASRERTDRRAAGERERLRRRAELIIQVSRRRRCTSISAGNTIITKGHKGMEKGGRKGGRQAGLTNSHFAPASNAWRPRRRLLFRSPGYASETEMFQRNVASDNAPLIFMRKT